MQGFFCGLVTFIGRVALCAIFGLSAVGHKIPHFEEVAAEMTTEGIPAAKLMLTGAIAFLLAGSLFVILGYKARWGAAMLLVFLALATYYFHDFWIIEEPEKRAGEMIQFMKNLALAGAMLVIVGAGAGPWSIDNISDETIESPA